MNGNAVDPRKIIVVKLAIRTAPTGQNSRGRIVERFEIGRLQFVSGGAITELVIGVIGLLSQLFHAAQRTIRQSVRISVFVSKADGVPPVGRPILQSGWPGTGVAA